MNATCSQIIDSLVDFKMYLWLIESFLILTPLVEMWDVFAGWVLETWLPLGQKCWGAKNILLADIFSMQLECLVITHDSFEAT